jgi:putative transposase
VQLTEQHIIKTDEWRHWCVKAKNLYNQSLYYWRQSVFGNVQYFSEYELLSLFREFKEENFIELPSHCGQEVIKNLFKNIKSWQKSRKEYKKNPSKFFGRPKMPKYKKELSVLSFNNCQVKLKKGFVHFPKMIGIAPMKTNISNIQSCRVIPKSNHFVVEFVYEFKETKQKKYNNKALGIDLGMNNIASCVSTTGEGFIINGRPLKSINQYYNKKKAKLQSNLDKNIFTTKRIEKLTLNRNNKIKNYLHHASKYVIEQANTLDITKIIIGKNNQWKTGINLGNKTNQNFVFLPHANLVKLIEYKGKKEGIEVIKTEESYTSKCSALDLEPIKKHENYVGRRTKRGLFRTKNGLNINADQNGATNILRKVIGNDFLIGFNTSAVIAPRKINLFKQNRVKSKVF